MHGIVIDVVDVCISDCAVIGILCWAYSCLAFEYHSRVRFTRLPMHVPIARNKNPDPATFPHIIRIDKSLNYATQSVMDFH